MANLRLGAYKLPAAEVVLVQTLFRLYAHTEGFRWTFVNEGPYDALLADGTTPEGSSPEVDRMARSVLRLTRMNSGEGANVLERPIRSDKLEAWLKSTERSLELTRPMTDATPAPAMAAGSLESDEAQLGKISVRFKLKRWPPAALLRADPNRIRMATLLSRRAMNAAELSAISQQSVQECQLFLQTLQTTGLVEMEQAQAVSAPTAAAAAVSAGGPGASSTPSAPAAAPRPAFGMGLISGIRRRLGL